MSEASSSLQAVIRQAVVDVLDAAIGSDQSKSRSGLDNLRDVLAGRSLLGALTAMVDGRLNVSKIDTNLYLLGDTANAGRLADANAYVHSALGVTSPLILAWIDEAAATPRHSAEPGGTSLIQLNADASMEFANLVHEFVHCYVRSGHRMLDEGLAEWMCTLAVSASPEDAANMLEKAAVGAPAIDVIAAQRWTAEPCFESLGAPAGSVHARCALAVARIVGERGMGALIALMNQVADEQVEDVRDQLVESEEINGPAGVVRTQDEGIYRKIRSQFLMGIVGDATQTVDDFRLGARMNPDDAAMEAAYLQSLLLAAEHPDANDLRAELDISLERFLTRHGNEPMAFALCISREGLKIRYAADFIAMNNAFQRGRSIIDAALEYFHQDLDVLAAAAKFELYTPAEYGGNIGKARNLLTRAAAVANDDVISNHFRAAMLRLDTKEAAA